MPDQIWALVMFALVATGSPGGATTLATASGARFGYGRSFPLILGVALALAGLVAVSGAGLAATLQAAPVLELSVKAVGSIYLIWLAARIGLAGSPSRARRAA
jgi:threonine/homoserine/homoserine lactone efflux protein